MNVTYFVYLPFSTLIVLDLSLAVKFTIVCTTKTQRLRMPATESLRTQRHQRVDVSYFVCLPFSTLIVLNLSLAVKFTIVLPRRHKG
jgi:hypothetical protein